MTMYTFVLGTGEESNLADNKLLDHFLGTVERRAFLMARTSLGNTEDAQDCVQDTMMLLVKKYRHKSEEEWRLLFFRILNNRIRDMVRRRTVRNRFTGWLSAVGKDPEDEYDPFQDVPDDPANEPSKGMERFQSMIELDAALEKLPRRQLEAFMLRCWEGLSTADTAAVMGCSEGSVKTHYFRALSFLQTQLEAHRDE